MIPSDAQSRPAAGWREQHAAAYEFAANALRDALVSVEDVEQILLQVLDDEAGAAEARQFASLVRKAINTAAGCARELRADQGGPVVAFTSRFVRPS